MELDSTDSRSLDTRPWRSGRLNTGPSSKPAASSQWSSAVGGHRVDRPSGIPILRPTPSGSVFERRSLMIAPCTISSNIDEDHNEVGDPMRHFDLKNRHEIKDAKPDILATVRSSDSETFSELSRNGFHLVEMSGEVWTMRRYG